jgi:hypothetical protein
MIQVSAGAAERRKIVAHGASRRGIQTRPQFSREAAQEFSPRRKPSSIQARPQFSRGAAQEFSPRRKPWGWEIGHPSPGGAQEFSPRRKPWGSPAGIPAPAGA